MPRFSVEPKERNGLVWKPSAIKGAIKQSACASVFDATSLSASAALTQVWRCRFYTKENMLAPAKPLWYLACALALDAGQVQRIV